LRIEKRVNLGILKGVESPKESQVTEKQCKTQRAKTKQLTAKDVHELTSQVLQEQFPLDREQSRYSASDIWDVLVAAAVQCITIEAACNLLEDAPSPNTVRQAVRALLADETGLAQLEVTVNQLLRARLPKTLFKRSRVCAVDFTDIPYHGQHEEDDAYVRRGRAKSGTTHFHSYATLAVVQANRRYTLAITLLRRADKALDVLRRVLHTATQAGLRVRRLLLDREFDNNAILAFLAQQPFPTIMPVRVRGRGGVRRVIQGRKSHTTTYTRASKRYGDQVLPLTIVCRYKKGRFGDFGIQRLAYVTIGELKITPHQIADEYRRRFGIETSYRLMNTMRIRTTSTSAALRLFFVALALLLLNLWSYVKWSHLFIPKRGPRQVLHPLLPLARWRLWLWEIVKLRQGFSLSLSIPLSV
jgi:putative transposase